MNTHVPAGEPGRASSVYQAGPGWDYATGLGAPDMDRLAAAVIAEASGR